MNRGHVNARLVARFRSASTLAALIVIVIGGLVMVGWVFQLMPLKAIVRGLPTMKFNSALCFVFLGLALLLMHRRPNLAIVLSVIVAAIGLLTVSQYLFRWDLGIDQWLIQESGRSAQDGLPGRMAFITALNFFLLGIGIILISRFRRFGPGQFIALLTGLTGLLSLAGYLYGVDSLYRLIAFSSIALHTAIAFIILSLGILFAHPQRGLAEVITADYAGGLLARRLLPVAVLFPLIFGWIRLRGQEMGFYDTQFGLALFALSNVVVFTVLIFLVARSLNVVDSQRSSAMEALRQARDELEGRVQERTQELAQTYNALESSERTLRLLVNNVREYAIYMLDRDGNIISWNDGAEYLEKYTESEILGQNFSRFYTPEDIVSGEPQRILQIAEREGQFVGEGWRVRKDGSRFWASIVVTAIHDESGALIGFSKIARDLTESMERQRQLLFHASLQEAVRDAVIATDLNFKIQSWNKAAERIYGWRFDEAIGKTVPDLFKTEFINQQSRDQILHDFAEYGYWTGEVIQHQKDGTPIDILGSTVMLRDEWGNSLGIVAVNHDITERKREQEALRLSEERYRNLSSILWDYACAYRYVSENEAQLEWVVGAFEEITGHSSETFAKFNLSLPVHPDDQEIFSRRHQALRSGQDDISEFRIINTRNEIRWLRSYGRPEWDSEHQKIVRVYIGVQDITERKQVEVALAEERNRLRTLVDALPDYIYLKDKQSRFQLINNAVFANSGVSDPDQILGKTDFDFFPSELAQVFYDDDQQVMTSGKALVSKEEPSVDRRTGQPLWFLTTKVPLRDEHGTITGLLGISRNITERKQIEIALADERNRLRVLIDTLPDYIYVKDTQHRFLLSNIAHARARGCETPEQLIGKTDFDFFPPVMAETFHAEEDKILRTGRPLIDYEQPSRGYKGGFTWALSNKVPLRSVNGELIGLVGITRDITERKQVENLFRELLESAPDAMIIADTEGRITLVNSRAEQLFGYAKSELVGKSVEILMPEVFHTAHVEHRKAYVRGSIPRAMGTGRDLYAMRKDGTGFPVEISLSPIETDGRKLVASAIRDISLHKQAAQALDEARMRAEEANKLKSEFLATMSHELRTPLNSIIGFSDVMLNNLAGNLNESQREYTEIILNNGEHLLSLINNLLDVSKIEAGQFDLHNTQVNLRVLVEDLRRNLQALADDKGLSLLTFVDPAIPRTIIGDEMRLKQILINLVGNSIKFTEAGHVEVRIMKGEMPWWVITVSDTGIGIPAEALGYVFDRFRQVDNSSTRQYEGSGLGLAIVRRLCELMGGSVTVHSKLHEGSIFTITLPLFTE